MPNASSGAKGPSINLHKKRSEPDNGASRPDSGFCNASNFGRSCRLWAHTTLAFPIETRQGVFFTVKHGGAVVAAGVCLFVFQVAEGCMKVGEKAVCVIYII